MSLYYSQTKDRRQPTLTFQSNMLTDLGRCLVAQTVPTNFSPYSVYTDFNASACLTAANKSEVIVDARYGCTGEEDGHRVTLLCLINNHNIQGKRFDKNLKTISKYTFLPNTDSYVFLMCLQLTIIMYS